MILHKSVEPRVRAAWAKLISQATASQQKYVTQSAVLAALVDLGLAHIEPDFLKRVCEMNIAVGRPEKTEDPPPAPLTVVSSEPETEVERRMREWSESFKK